VLSKLVPSAVLALLVSEIALIFTAYIATFHLLSEFDALTWLLHDAGLLRIGLLAAALILALYFQDLYSRISPSANFLLVQQYCLAFGVGYLIQALLSYAVPVLTVPRRTMMYGSMVLLVALPLWRITYTSLVVQVLAADRLLFLGASHLACRVVQRIKERPELGLLPIGFVADPEEREHPDGAPVLGPIAEFRAIVDRMRPDRVVVGLVERRQKLPVLDLLDVNFSGIAVEDALATYEQVFQRVSTERLRPSQLIFSRELGPRRATVRLQSLYSFWIALVTLVVASPVMLLVALLVRLTSSGPVLYRQTRVGRNGVPFTMYKFRSMRTDAEKLTGAVWAARDDPRVTPLGRVLRRLRLDELPQLFNILRGDMSIVGPRPERPEFVATLSEQIPFYPQRHCLRPGVTGWAQINHKYGDSLEDTVVKLEYDLYYIKNLSPALDFYIILQTLKVVLLSRGAQ
jgi:sugar transferase (PEP-CTERM system associated)